MRKVIYIALFGIVAMSLSSCFEDKCTGTQSYMRFEPVYMSKDFLRQPMKVEDKRTLKKPGKIYFYNDHLFLNEVGEGIHVYNMEDESNPDYVKFYSIPGNFDLAIKDDILYADNAIDLISIDISDLENPVEVDRDSNVVYKYEHFQKGVLVYYDQADVMEEIDCNNFRFGNRFFFEDDVLFSVDLESASTGISSTGVGGSTARFTVVEDMLYMVDNTSLNVFSVENAADPDYRTSKSLGWGIETIFPYEDNLFIGSNSGMYIFDNQNPTNPTLLSVFEHATACDPVVVEGNTAYVTLRDGSECAGFNNQLDVIDITDLTDPRLIKTYPMSNPHGLSVRNDILYLCEGTYGLKVFNVSDKEKVDKNLLGNDEGVYAVDVIALTDDRLFVVGNDGFHQYDSSDPSNLKLLGSILIGE